MTANLSTYSLISSEAKFLHIGWLCEVFVYFLYNFSIVNMVDSVKDCDVGHGWCSVGYG